MSEKRSRISSKLYPVLLVGIITCLTVLLVFYNGQDNRGDLTENRDKILSDNTRQFPISIEIQKGRAFDSDYTIARIRLTEIGQMRTAFASGYSEQTTEKVSVLSERAGAVLAVNGDYYRFKQDGFICRNGEIYREAPDGSRDVLIIDTDGELHIIREAKQEAIQPYIGTAYQGFTFGPGLVVDGIKQNDFRDNDNSAFSPAQRMCIAQTGQLEYLLIAVDGKESGESKGMTIEQLATFVSEIPGVRNAYNLDGGFSVTMIYRQEKLNKPAKERPVCDIIYFVGAEEMDEP